MNLYYFNPGCELEVAFGKPNYSLQKNPRILEHDLSTIPMCFAGEGDFVASDTRDTEFVNFWEKYLGCRFAAINSPEVRRTSFDRFVPWGISPRILKIGSQLKLSPEYTNGPVGSWKTEHRELFSRETSAEFFRNLITENSDCEYFPDISELPIVARSIGEATCFFQKAKDSRFNGSVFKATFGSSGRGIRIFRNNLLTDNIINWTQSILSAQGSLTCEYLFNKVCDFSMHYQIDNGKASFVGVSSFNTAENGSYQSSIVKRFSEIPGFPEFPAEKLAQMHIAILNKSIYTKIYTGPLGIDCMVYNEELSSSEPTKKINPCIEINCRHSMGRLAMEMSRIVADDKNAEYHVFQKNGQNDVSLNEPVFEDGKLAGGFLALTPNDTTMFTAGIRIL